MKFSIAILAVLLAACNSINSPITIIPPTPTMTATVNGSSWSTIGTLGTGSAKATRNNSTGLVTVTGVSTDLTEITLLLSSPKANTTSQFLISGDAAVYSQGIPDSSKSWFTSPTLTNPLPGTVTITTFDTTKGEISGSFSFVARKLQTASDSVTVTNGSFSHITWSK